MRTRALLVLLSLSAAAAVVGGFAANASTPAAFAAAPPSSTTPPVALLATRPGALHSSLYLARIGGSSPGAPVATFNHLADAVVRGAVLPGSQIVLATADTAPSRDLSFNASLFKLAPHAPPELLCDRVVHASRPLVTPGGQVFVSRGTRGPELTGAMRLDSLSVDEIDPATGAARPIHQTQGYLTFLAGSLDRELLLYRVGPGHADIAAVHMDSGAVRVIVASLPPFARDFSVDSTQGTLVFQGRHETDSHTWVIERVDITTGKQTRLFASPSMNLAPYAWPGGGIAYTPRSAAGLTLQGAPVSLNGPLGPGVDVILAASPGGQHVAALHTVAGSLPVPFAIDTRTGTVTPLPAPAGTRIAIAGFVADAGGAQ
jgi:hypothetical protein